VELCGQFVSSEHSRMIALARHFKPEGYEHALMGTGGNAGLMYFGETDGSGNNDGYTWDCLCEEWAGNWWGFFNGLVNPQNNTQGTACPWPTQYNLCPSAPCVALDEMTVTSFVETYLGANTNFGRLMLLSSVAEYAGDPDTQSALNLVYLMGYDDSLTGGKGYQPSTCPVLAGTDEDYQITYGNDGVLTGMMNDLPSGTLKLGQSLCSIVLSSDGTYSCTFGSGNYCTTTAVVADHVVLAVPWTVLRNGTIDLSQAGISPLKMAAIGSLGMGANVKVATQLDLDGGPLPSSGNGFLDLPQPNNAPSISLETWAAFNSSANVNGIAVAPAIINSFGGNAGMAFGANYLPAGAPPQGWAQQGGTPILQQLVTDTLHAADLVWSTASPASSVTANYANVMYYHWPFGDPLIGGSWSYYMPTQYTTFSGVEPLPEGPAGHLHFAGEQTSLDFQGFMEGAVESGYRCADEIMTPTTSFIDCAPMP
jgi:monoamine oxidase